MQLKFRLHDGEGNIIGYETHEPNEFGVINIWHETLRDEWTDGLKKGLVREGYFIPCKHKFLFTNQQSKSGQDIYEHDLVLAFKGNSSLGNKNDVYQVIYDKHFAQFVFVGFKSNNDYRIGRIPTKKNQQPFLLSNTVSVVGYLIEQVPLKESMF